MASTDEMTRLLFATGESLVVRGALDEVAKDLQNAARSSPGTLAWFDEATADERHGVNPVHVVSIRRAG